MKNIQIIDAAINATFSIFQASLDDFNMIFPDSRDMEFVEEFIQRIGEYEAGEILARLWTRPVLKRDAHGIHGTLFYEWLERREHYPATKREVDWDEGSINEAQRVLFQNNR